MDLTQIIIVDSTLREGEQFVSASFTTNQKLHIARLLDAFGVGCIEVTSPIVSPTSFTDCQAITRLGLKAEILAHTRCHPLDIQRAIDSGVDGVNLVFGTSSYLRRFSHGRDIDAIIEAAHQSIELARGAGVKVRFSAEDSMRSDPTDLFRIYEAVDALGVNRVGVADTVGVGTPHAIAGLVAELRSRVQAEIEFHGHNDTGCAIANAFAAAEAGARYIDTSVLGIGERNGITPLGGLIARLHATNSRNTAHYNLPLLAALDRFVAEVTGVGIPFNNYITGACAFSHKAGIHTKAVLANPATYECLNPDDFGMQRQVLIGHRLTGRHALAHRANQLGLMLSEEQLAERAARLKDLSHSGDLSAAQVDGFLRQEEVSHVANIG